MKKENCLKQNINLPQMLHLLLEKPVFRKQKKNPGSSPENLKKYISLLQLSRLNIKSYIYIVERKNLQKE
jgi:hypothetical protein